MSGGVCWVANNPGMAKEGIADSDEEGFTYLKHITKGEVPDEMLWLYIRESKRVLAYLHEKTHVRYVPLAKYTDYYPEAPGGRPGGRSMDPIPFDGSKLREDLIRCVGRTRNRRSSGSSASRRAKRRQPSASASRRCCSWRGRCSCTRFATSNGSAGAVTRSSAQATP